MKINKEYFQHDIYCINDPKIIAMIEEHGAPGYAYFWRIVEMLHEAEDHKLPFKKYIYIAIAKQMKANAEQVESFINSCINDYDLLKSDASFFWSNRVLININKRSEISAKRSESGRLGGVARQKEANANQMPLNKKDNTNVLSKEKENNINIGFGIFWDLYNKKNDKVKSEKKWLLLTDIERQLIIEDIPKYIKSLKDLQYQKNPLSYLNGKCWLDERDTMNSNGKIYPIDPTDPVPRKVVY